jgi:hypothetical protein
MALPDNLFVGTVSWSKSDWVGCLYPPDLKPSQFLETYARIVSNRGNRLHILPHSTTLDGHRLEG